MTTNQNTIFLRNDDVRQELDPELITLTEMCIDLSIPLTHAVEPANVSNRVVEWLLNMKSKNPNLIEIIQHGYDHNLSKLHQKMEFGGTRNYEDQYNAIIKGKKMMNSYFGEAWSPVFTFPYGTYNFETLSAVNDAGYKVISSKVNFSFKNRFKNRMGRLFGTDFILDKKISYHTTKRPHFDFHEISVSANVIRKYTGNRTAIHYSKSEVLQQIATAQKFTNQIGLLFHHRFHTKEFPVFANLLKDLKQMGYHFSTIIDLIR